MADDDPTTGTKPEETAGAAMIRAQGTDPGLDVPDALVESIRDRMEHDVHGELA